MAFVAGLFCAMGLWVVLPFSGLEWIILAIALHWSLWNSELREVLTIDPDRVIVERGRRSSEQRYEFQRAWIQLLWREPKFRGYPGLLVLRSHGKQVVSGGFLPETERKKLKQELEEFSKIKDPDQGLGDRSSEGYVKNLKALLAVSVMAFVGEARADYALNLTEGVTELSKDIHDLHMLIFWICVAIGVLVYGLLIYSLVKFRKSKGAVASDFHENTKLEVLWTVIPFLILLGMAVPATKVMLKAYDVSGADMTIKVTGYQWKWRYEYLDDGLDFFSTLDAKSNEARQLNSKLKPSDVPNYLLEVDHPLVIPTGKKIRFLFTGADVIHSWWVPDLGWKKDTIPGFITDGWTKIDKPGIYRGQCTELCGRDHGFMPIVVIAKPEAEYKEWLAAQKGGSAQSTSAPVVAAPETTAAPVVAEAATSSAAVETANGQKVYETHCAGCHQTNGEGIPGLFPAIKGSKVVNGPLDDHIKIVLNGKPPMMSSFKNILTPEEVAAVITYQRNSFGNSTGDVVHASDVLAHH